MNSLVWLVWHMARTEDAAMNLLGAGRPQVLDEGDWRDRLNLRHDIGTTMSDEEVEGFSQNVDVAAVLAYRIAVGKRTREIVKSLRPEELSVVVEPAQVEALLEQGAIVEAAARRFAGFWGGKTKAFFLNMPATGHNFMHLSEAITVRRNLKCFIKNHWGGS